MNLKELTRPVRLYWDLPESPADAGRCLDICEEIIALKILFLSLRDTASQISPSCLDILDRLRGNTIAVSLTLPGPSLTPSVRARLAVSPVKNVLIDSASCGEVRAFFEMIRQPGDPGMLPGISFDVGNDNYGEIPEVVSFCLDNGIRDLVFPIQRLAEGRDVSYVKAMEREEIALKLSGMDYRSVRVTIHDPFLWKVFYPDADYHEGGCQAANSMLYISPRYRVYPCPAMPVELGDLRETTLTRIIQSGWKKELRSSLLKPPAECAVCEQALECQGGCRGRALAAEGSLSRRDPACI